MFSEIIDGDFLMSTQILLLARAMEMAIEHKEFFLFSFDIEFLFKHIFNFVTTLFCLNLVVPILLIVEDNFSFFFLCS